MINTLIYYEIICNKCGCKVNDEHLNSKFTKVLPMIEYAKEGGWLFYNYYNCYCDKCRKDLENDIPAQENR